MPPVAILILLLTGGALAVANKLAPLTASGFLFAEPHQQKESPATGEAKGRSLIRNACLVWRVVAEPERSEGSVSV
jgi:hypothetical protein